jgi:hypothetical protein
MLLKEKQKRIGYGEEDVSNQWVDLRKREDGKH